MFVGMVCNLICFIFYLMSLLFLSTAPTIDSMEIIPGSPNNFLKVDFTRGIGIDVSQRNVWRITWSGPVSVLYPLQPLN